MSELAQQLIAENKAKHLRGEDAAYLDLGRCGLRQIPDLSGMDWLETLILSNYWFEWDIQQNDWVWFKSQNGDASNQIIHPPASPLPISLKKLVLCGCNISDGSFLTNLTHLTSLDLSNNNISDGSFLKNLTHLTSLYLSDNQISDGSFLTNLTNLTSLNLSTTQIRDWSFLKNLTKLTSLNLSNNEISDWSFFQHLTNLTSLYLSGNQISDGSFFQHLTKLTSLNLGYNQIRDGSFFQHLTKLTSLNLSDNQIRDGSFFQHLTKLTSLNLSDNQIRDGSFFQHLTKLTSLDLRDNQISDWSFFQHLTNLTSLDLSYNQISDGSFFQHLTKLTRIVLNNNHLTDLQPLLFFIKEKNMKVVWDEWYKTKDGELNIEKNPLTNPPVEIVQQGNEAILNYFAEKEKSGTEKSLEAKVVLIGEGQAGKTSLRTRLLRPGEALPSKEDRTKGLDIEIEKYQYALTNGELMRLNVFDFGGQDHYKPLHQFFYSKNTLYVLVSKNGDVAVNDFDFWLDTAQLFGQNSPVLLVHNLFGDVRSGFNRSKYERFEETIKDCLDVNLGDFEDTRWPEVQSRIEYFASRLPHVHEEIPKSWANVRRTLLARRDEQVLDLEEYLALCALDENGEMDKARALRCSEYLHDIGVILHYQDDADLREYVIVRNEWATDAAYRVIDDAEIEKRNGHFSRQDDLPRIWHQAEYRKMRPQLLQLMRRFRLCYPLKTDGEYIAPQLLPVSPPAGYAWAPDQDLVVYVEYDFMPPGLMSQLIVECYLLIAEERRLVWRDGAVLELGGGEARAEILLQKRSGKQTIAIRAQGRKRRDLMTVVDARMEELHKPFGNGLKVEKKIPCICARCTKTDDKWFFNLSELENRLRAGIKTKDCELSYEAVSIDALLGNVFSKEVRQSGGKAAARVFFSYSKADALYLDEFKKYLKVMERNGDIEPWDDTKIRPGEEWDEAIKRELRQADMIFLLVSVDFLATDYIWDIEIKEAMRRHENGEAAVIPIKIRDCDWGETSFADLQGLPRKDGIIGPNPVNDAMWTQVVKEIGALLKGRR
jgi:internalin A